MISKMFSTLGWGVFLNHFLSLFSLTWGLAGCFVCSSISRNGQRFHWSFLRGLIVTSAAFGLFIAIMIFLEVAVGQRRSGKTLFDQDRSTTNESQLTGDLTGAELSQLIESPHDEEAPSPPLGTDDLQDSDSQCSNFSYNALATDEIRLLKILPGNKMTDVLELVLVHISVISARTKGYTALSYTWGTATASTKIYIDGSGMLIRPNLAQALCKLRTLGYEYLWVDAICINQEDIQECSKQVLRMRGIYAGAQSVLVSIEISDASASHLTRLFALANPSLGRAAQNDEFNTLLSHEATIAAFRTFCSNAYWGRLWIIQEFVTGVSVSLLIANAVVGIDSVAVVLTALKKRLPEPKIYYAKKLFDLRTSVRNGLRPLLLDLLSQTWNSQCGNRHDRVFGLLGLASDGVDIIWEPNYDTDFASISFWMTQSFISRDQLEIILLGPDGGNESRKSSWCPNYFHFDKSRPESRIVKQMMRKRTRGPFANTDEPGRWYATGYSSPVFSISGPVLKCTARQLGVVSSLGWIPSDVNNSMFPMHDESWARRCQTLNITRMLFRAICQSDTTSYWQKYTFLDNFHAYSFLRVFLESHGPLNPESTNHMLRWVCANRHFFAGGQLLKNHASRLLHPFLYYNVLAYHPGRYYSAYHDIPVFRPMAKIPSSTMRLLYLDHDNFGIGWAHARARIHDEVFLLSGCSVPVILRKNGSEGKFQVIGDAIVMGAMDNEVWKDSRAQDVVQVEII